MRRPVTVMITLSLCGGLFIGNSTAQKPVREERKVLEKVAPVYPELAKRLRARGVVKLEVVIRANGEVESTNVIGGSPILVGAATDAVKKWKFEAASEETTEVVRLTFEPN